MFDCWDLTTATKLKVYNQCVIPLSMYGSETWTLYRKQVRQLRTIQQRHLRFILKIKWDDFVTNDEVLCLAKADDIELLLNKNRMRWLGHVACMPETRAVKVLLYCELAEGKRKVGCPMLRFKDTMSKMFSKEVKFLILGQKVWTINLNGTS